jgi:riboflavin kinase/FMN adenylyltransferase
MKVHYHIEKLPIFTNAVITIGTFDGVHLGHKSILEQLKNEAKSINGETIVITFHPHPRKIIQYEESPALLTSVDERIGHFEKSGIDHLVIVPFDLGFSELEALRYISDFLVANFHPKIIIIGYDHRFGKDRQGDYVLMKDLGVEFGYTVIEIPQKLLNDSKISSSQIRNCLLEGKVEKAAGLLGYSYQLEGIVIKGDQLGRKIGYPTANLLIIDTEKLIPAGGVYAVSVVILKDGQRIEKFGMMNIGYRPTVNGKERRIEVHIFEFDDDIYGSKVIVELKHFIRNEIKFSGLDALRSQLDKDKNTCIEKFAEESL